MAKKNRPPTLYGPISDSKILAMDEVSDSFEWLALYRDTKRIAAQSETGAVDLPPPQPMPMTEAEAAALLGRMLANCQVAMDLTLADARAGRQFERGACERMARLAAGAALIGGAIQRLIGGTRHHVIIARAEPAGSGPGES